MFFSRRCRLATTSKMTSAINARHCSIDGSGDDDGKSNSFSFGSTALALSCDEAPPSPCLRGIRGSKVRDLNGGVDRGAEGTSALMAEERERERRRDLFLFFSKNRPSTSNCFFFSFTNQTLLYHSARSSSPVRGKTPHWTTRAGTRTTRARRTRGHPSALQLQQQH